MLEGLLRQSISSRGLVLVFTALVALLGIYNFGRLPIDAVPDITNVQVVVNTQAPGYTPLEVEQRVSFPLETAMAGARDLAQRFAREIQESEVSVAPSSSPHCSWG